MTYKFTQCTLCPRNCKTDRTQRTGVCGADESVRAARAALHFWEEPCISGAKGSGTVFFSGCTLKCCFCQNYEISHENKGRDISLIRLSDIFLELQDAGAENINLVNPTHYVPQIINALDMVRHRLHIPIVYNSGGYEKTETLKLLDGYIDIYMPDLKYMSREISEKYSKASDYFFYASKAVIEMHRQQPNIVIDGSIMKKGLLIRHLVLPGCRRDSMALLEWLGNTFTEGSFLLSLMSQFTPCYKCGEHPEINRRVTTLEYESVADKAAELGFEGYTQQRSSAQSSFTPKFDLEGIQTDS